LESRDHALTPFRIAALFLVAGIGWIVATDALVSSVAQDSARAQTIKGLVFVTGTAALLWALLRYAARHRDEALGRLAESEQRFRALIENANEMISIIRPDGRPVFRNQGYTRILGYDPDEVESTLDLIHPRDLPAVEEVLDLVMRRPAWRSEPVEFRVRHRDGGWRMLEGTATNLEDHPAVGGIVVHARDVTERRAARMQLAMAERRFRQIVERAHGGVWTVDQRGQTTYVNDRMAEMLGYPPEEIVGRLILEFVPPENRTFVEETFERRREGVAEEIETELVRADGERITIRSSSGPLYDEDGEFAGALAMVTDVTERRAMEKRLRQTERMEAIGHLAGGMAHEFNNVLTVIRGYASVLRGGFDEDDPRRENAEEIMQAAERAVSLTRQLLAFGRRQMLEPRRVDLDAIVRDAEPEVRTVLPENVALEIDTHGALPEVRVDPAQMKRVLVYLALNARDAMPGGGTLQISTGRERVESERPMEGFVLPADSYVSLVVRDDGFGMEGETRKRAFEPFFTTRAEPGRTGLGLASVYGLVKQSGGFVWVESRPDEETAFHVLLPEAGEEEVEPGGESAPGSETGPDRAGAPSGTAVVLLVEDESAVRRLARAVLERAGCEVLEAASGREALESMERRNAPVDLVLTDVVMPAMSGPEFIERLRERWPDLKVVFTSGYADQGIVEGPVARTEVGAGVAFLPKPFTPRALVEKVEEVLGSTLPGD